MFGPDGKQVYVITNENDLVVMDFASTEISILRESVSGASFGKDGELVIRKKDEVVVGNSSLYFPNMTVLDVVIVERFVYVLL
jgi:hypothetical protein